MPAVIHLPNLTSINLEDALDSGENILVRNAQFCAMEKLHMQLWENRPAVTAIVAAHIGVSPDRLNTVHLADWLRGGFNLVIPIQIKAEAGAAPDAEPDTVILRVPLPYELGEEQHPGSVADKLRREVASYIYMQRHCPEIRIPHLYGFSIPGENGGQVSVVRRAVLYIRQLVASWLRRPVPSAYVPVAGPPIRDSLPLARTGYMIIEHFSEARFGKQIPYILPRDRPLHEMYAQEPEKTRTLCRGLARTMLALARVPQPRIGAFRFCTADGTIRLDGRPVTCGIAIREAEGAPRTIPLDATYTSAGQYASDLARFYESAYRADPNVATAPVDAHSDMATMVCMRAMAHHFVGKDKDKNGDGPYVLHLSDSNAGNVLINDDWQVTAIFDLEWLYAAPAAQLRPPSWLTWQSIGAITGDGYDGYCASRRVFMDVLREEEKEQKEQKEQTQAPLSDAMDASWASEHVWFYAALTSVNGMWFVFHNRLRPLFWPDTADAEGKPVRSKVPYDALYPLWQAGADAVAAQKVREMEEYVVAVRRLFQDK